MATEILQSKYEQLSNQLHPEVKKLLDNWKALQEKYAKEQSPIEGSIT